MNTLVQQISATEALAAVDTICVDKTGTLTDGSLELIGVVSADPIDAGVESTERALARFAASAGERNRTLESIAESFPAEAVPVVAEVPVRRVWGLAPGIADSAGDHSRTLAQEILRAPEATAGENRGLSGQRVPPPVSRTPAQRRDQVACFPLRLRAGPRRCGGAG